MSPTSESSVQDLYRSSAEDPFIIAGPCVLEEEGLVIGIADALAKISSRLDTPLVFKSSFDKANRTSLQSFRGPGLEQGLKLLSKVKKQTGLPVLTDIHAPDQAFAVAEVADVLQIPAFLCRQTDLLVAAAETGKIVNVKKGQFLAPWDMEHALNKIQSVSREKIWLTERGSSFGYNNLVVDMRGVAIMRELGVPVVFDATHSVQLPGGKGSSSGGQRDFVPVLARAAVAAGCSGIFLEVHPEPEKALCDGPNSWPLDETEDLLRQLLDLWDVVNGR